jgi:hypothetical protein
MRYSIALVGAGEFHAFSGLDASDDHGVVLNFQVGLKDFDVDGLALLRGVTLGAHAVQFEIALVGGDETLDGRIHEAIVVADEAADIMQTP